MHDASRVAVNGVPAKRGAEWSPRRFWQCPGVPLEQALQQPTGKVEAAAAYVNQGRWVVDCPDCHGAQLACSTDRRFMCVECANVVVGGVWRPVLWPRNAAAIEEALASRLPVNANWFPGETVETLREEQLLQEGLALMSHAVVDPPELNPVSPQQHAEGVI